MQAPQATPSILIGPGGSNGRGHIKGLQEVARRGLDCMEIEFTYGVRMTPEMAEAVGALADDLGIALSVHAPYYINLASYEDDKVDASRKRILDSCHRAHQMGARIVVFHAGFYQKRSPRETYRLIRHQVIDLQNHIRKADWQVTLCPEITGKPSQFGSTEELLELIKDTGCGITVDFAHLYARNQGVIDYENILRQLPQKFHAHFSGIEYTAKGEKRHIDLTGDFFLPLAQALLSHKPDTTLICESPHPMTDATTMKKIITRHIFAK